MNLKFEDPPARSFWTTIVEELQQHPGQWAVVKEYLPDDPRSSHRARATANFLKKSYRLEITVRLHKIYARWPAEKP